MRKGTVYAILMSLPILFIAYIAAIAAWIAYIEPVVSFLGGPSFFLRFAVPAGIAMYASLAISSKVFRNANYGVVTLTLLAVVTFNVISRLVLAIYRDEEWFVIEKVITLIAAFSVAKATLINIEDNKE